VAAEREIRLERNRAVLEKALTEGDIYAIGGSVYGPDHNYLFVTTDLADLRGTVDFHRIDSGGRPTWRRGRLL